MDKKKKDKSEKHLSNEELISLYSLFHDLQKRCTDEICSYMKIYINSNIIILGGGIAIFSTMKESPFKYISLFLCGLLVIIFSITYMKSTKKVFNNQLEYIAQTAHIEGILKFHDKKIYNSKEYFQEEGLIISRHFDNRKKCADENGISSKKRFVDIFIKDGQRKYIRAIGITFIIFGILLSTYPIISLILGFGL